MPAYKAAMDECIKFAQYGRGNYGTTSGNCTSCYKPRKTLHGCGWTLYSYGIVIATREAERDGLGSLEYWVHLNYSKRDRGWSATTSRHRRSLEAAMDTIGDWFESKGIYGAWRLKVPAAGDYSPTSPQ